MLLNTDQTNCYSELGEEIPCPGSGLDAENRSVPEVTGRRFEIAGDIVTDGRTGQHWSRNASPATFPMSWREAFEYIEGLNASKFLGRNDWRLPDRRELFSLISHQYINPSLPEAHPFTDVFSGYYWTSSPCSRLGNQAWYIHLGGGRVYRGIKENSYMVWPVAGGQPDGKYPPGRFTAGGNTVLDRLTRRMWRASDDGTRPVTWQGAIDGIAALNRRRAEGFDDWRLPNIRELESLVDLDRHSPALPGDFGPDRVAEGYWSSTTSVYETRYAWVLYSRDGAVGVGFKPQADFGFWAVRNET